MYVRKIDRILEEFKTKNEKKAIVINVGAKSDYKDNMELGGVKNIRDYFTTGETGYSQMFIEDYQKRVNQEIMRIANQNVVLVNRKGRAISARNLAEMQVRYEEQVKDFEKLDKKGVKYVVATSHANASTRCQPWQGKIYFLDAEVGSVQIIDNHYDGEPKPIGKTPDGKDYYSLREAMTHGFLGYNCRHRLILYKPGMIMPKQYTANQVSKERNIELEKDLGHAFLTAKISSKIYEALGIDQNNTLDIKISDSKEGRLEHIIRRHKKFINDNFIKSIKITLENPDEIILNESKKMTVIKLKEYVISNNVKRDFVVVLQSTKQSKLKLVTAFVTDDDNYISEKKKVKH